MSESVSELSISEETEVSVPVVTVNTKNLVRPQISRIVYASILEQEQA